MNRDTDDEKKLTRQKAGKTASGQKEELVKGLEKELGLLKVIYLEQDGQYVEQYEITWER